MSRFLFPVAIALILASVAFAHWENSGPEPGATPATIQSPAASDRLKLAR
ncbi:hypothetical protein [Methylobacterium sp.]